MTNVNNGPLPKAQGFKKGAAVINVMNAMNLSQKDIEKIGH